MRHFQITLEDPSAFLQDVLEGKLYFLILAEGDPVGDLSAEFVSLVGVALTFRVTEETDLVNVGQYSADLKVRCLQKVPDGLLKEPPKEA